MRKINLHVVSLITALLFSVECDKASSQTTNAEKETQDRGKTKTSALIKSYEDYELIGERANEKYNLSFQITALNNDNWKGFDIAVRKTQTKRCLLYKTAYFDEGLADKTTEIFSPDEEFLALPCGAETSGYCIYKMSKVAEYFNNTGNFSEGKSGGDYCGNGSDTFKTPIETVDTIKIVDKKGAESFPHKLVGWKNNTIFVFQARAGEWHNFSYDVAEKKIYGSPEKIGAAKNEQGKIKFSQ